MRILIVEDDPKISDHIAANLRQEGHAAMVAADGEAGLRMISDPEENTFDALVLDLMLPKVDGTAVLATLRARGINIPVLILSALDSVQNRVHGLRNGADDYLVKPFAFDELIARLLSLVRRAGAASAMAATPTRLTAGRSTARPAVATRLRGKELIELQPREFALLEYFLSNVGRRDEGHDPRTRLGLDFRSTDQRGGCARLPAQK